MPQPLEALALFVTPIADPYPDDLQLHAELKLLDDPLIRLTQRDWRSV